MNIIYPRVVHLLGMKTRCQVVDILVDHFLAVHAKPFSTSNKICCNMIPMPYTHVEDLKPAGSSNICFVLWDEIIRKR
jgi:hypothetical protein